MPNRPLRRVPIVRVFALAIGTLLAATPARSQVPTSLTFFGDSFTDTGNGDILAALFGFPDPTPSPPFAPGRVSNGLVWSDYLALQFGLGSHAAPSLLGGRNHAVGSARTGLNGALGLPVGMLTQYAQQAAVPADPTGMYVVFGGGNDIFDAALLSTPQAQEAALQTAVGNLSTIAAGLYSQGARRFLIPSIADVGKAPAALGTPLAPILTALSVRFNQLLDLSLAALTGSLPGASLLGLRLDVLFENILIDVAQGGPRYGMTNATVPCFTGVPCATSVFVDGEHATTVAHALIADAAYDRIVDGRDVAAVPEPATIVMVGSALIVLGLAARRRQRRGAIPV